ncbi:glycosyltransferase family 52 [Aeromonas simiae]|uniref:Glycosyl transferase family 52 n=1 Tax=Aeromonas simiae TaxID=218936 RepID=A0A5J6WV39_9GAMM|nr:glycosyltransferase family 52 [Aeromonas simiae]QFI54996.1 glycosyl transferase family 52 [Aeromonas simiae]
MIYSFFLKTYSISRNKQIENICVIDNIHGLMTYIFYMPTSIDSTVFIVSDGVPEKVCKKLKYYVKVPSFKNHNKALAILMRVAMFFCCHIAVWLFFKKNNYKYVGHDHLFFSSPFLINGFILIEDGLANYVKNSERKNSLYNTTRQLFGYQPCFGYDKRIKKIILTGLDITPLELQDKAEIINIASNWCNMGQSIRNMVYDIFNYEYVNLSDSVVILTQPLSENQIISEDKKIKIYKDIVNKYINEVDGVNIVFKPHPREQTNYKNYFDCEVLPNETPFQIILLNSTPKVIATLFSSVAYGIEGIRVDMFGTSHLEEVAEKVGIYYGNVCL